MKKFLAVMVSAVLITACDKKDTVDQPEPVHPVMRYTNLGNLAIKFNEQKQLDLDGDNSMDVLFSTVLVGDPVLRRDRRQYFAAAAFDVSFLFNDLDQTPAFNNGDSIKLTSPAGYDWFNASAGILAEKIIEEIGDPHWEGNWKNANHKFLPVQIAKNNHRYNGWIEISFKTGTEELILHRAAISTEADKNIKAGK